MKILVEVEIKTNGNKCGDCRFNGKTRYAQPLAMHLPAESYQAVDWCGLFFKDLKLKERKINHPICKEYPYGGQSIVYSSIKCKECLKFGKEKLLILV